MCAQEIIIEAPLGSAMAMHSEYPSSAAGDARDDRQHELQDRLLFGMDHGMDIIASLRSAYYDKKEQLVIDATTIAKYGN